MVAMARHAARRFERAAEDIHGRVVAAVRGTLSRDPTLVELAELSAYAAENGLENLCRLLFNLNEFAFVD
jgi:hypothetical protein